MLEKHVHSGQYLKKIQNNTKNTSNPVQNKKEHGSYNYIFLKKSVQMNAPSHPAKDSWHHKHPKSFSAECVRRWSLRVLELPKDFWHCKHFWISRPRTRRLSVEMSLSDSPLFSGRICLADWLFWLEPTDGKMVAKMHEGRLLGVDMSAPDGESKALFICLDHGHKNSIPNYLQKVVDNFLT